jgi:hypothetical protein
VTNLPDRARRYSEREVALLLQRAAELQAEGAATPEGAPGLTLAQLEEIAREAGLDPAHVRSAAVELEERRAMPAPAPLLGAPPRLVFERRLDGEVPASAYEDLVAELTRTFGGAGQASAIGRTLTWTSSWQGGAGRRVTVSVTAHDGMTVLRVEESLAPVAGGLFGGIVGGMGGGGLAVAFGVGIGVFAAPLAAVAVAAAMVGGSYAIARGIYTALARQRGGELLALTDRLAERIAAAIPPQQTPQQTLQSPPLPPSEQH